MSQEAPTQRISITKPRDEEIDVYGMTHQGKVRKDNQDHFLICSLERHVNVRSTSLPDSARLRDKGDRLAFLAMVADGVGGGARGEEASRTALEEVTAYVTAGVDCYYTSDISDDTAFTNALMQGAVQAHEALLRSSATHSDGRGMATTLTLWLGVWPRAYLLQVGDSRYYVLRGDQLTQVSRDQTMAQDLIDQGVLTTAAAPRTRWAHTLSSAIGGAHTAPVAMSVRQDWGMVHMLCSDGLTGHVPDERIQHRLMNMTSAREACENLVQDALDGGGTDNITVIVGRALKR